MRTSTAGTDGLRSGSRRRRAFTIVEILTAIGVIAILAALLLPALALGRKTARLTRAKNELRNIQLACIQYMDTNYEKNPFLPPDEAVARPGWENRQAMALPTLIAQGYFDQARPFTAEELVQSIAGISGFDGDFGVGIGSHGSRIEGDPVLQTVRDPYYDARNPAFGSGTASNLGGPFGPNRDAIWVCYQGDRPESQRIARNVVLAIGSRGPDRAWQTNPANSSTGYVCRENGEDGDLFILLTNSGRWLMFPDETITNNP